MTLTISKRMTVWMVAGVLLASTPALADTKKTIVLVHGAWADGSSWYRVFQQRVLGENTWPGSYY